MASDKVRTLTDANFDATLRESAAPVLVDFWGERCPACDALAPQLDRAAAELDGRATIAKLKVEDNPEMTVRYRIRGIPSLLVFKGGELVDTALGSRDAQSIRGLVEKHL